MFFFIFFLLSFTWITHQQLYRIVEMEKTPNGLKGRLELNTTKPEFPPDVITKLEVRFFFESEDRLRMKVWDPSIERWEVPGVVISKTPEISPSSMKYDLDVDSEHFQFKITRISDKRVIFNSANFDFFYADQYIEMSSSIDEESNFYGLGERLKFKLDTDNKTYVLYSSDQGVLHDKPDRNLYGAHPFYLNVMGDASGSAHGVFILNSNAQQFTLSAAEKRITYLTIGGILDVFFFLGPSPKEVVRQYQEVVGFPFFPPYWSLGYHQCRWGYKKIDQTFDVVHNMASHEIPLETMWNDIDYMEDYKDFTVAPDRFPLAEVQKMVRHLHDNNQHYIQIIDPGIATKEGYRAYDEGMKRGIFIKEADGVTPLRNKVWPGYTYFPDFSYDKGIQYWSDMIGEYLADVELDGIWIDMNEIAAQCDGNCSSSSTTSNTFVKTTSEGNNFDPNHPPFTPGGQQLDKHTLRMDGVNDMSIQYNVHSLYGFHETVATSIALQNARENTRPFIISRSTFSGSGRYGGHWLGDNWAHWEDMTDSIKGCLAMNIFGVSMCGADICGFNADTTEELCSRWYNVGAFTPFMRNHNTIGARSQEPYAFGDTLLSASKNAISTRYELLPYIYTQYFYTHTQGEVLFRAMLFEYPDDPVAAETETQFMLGPAILVIPVLTEGEDFVKGYIPDNYYYDYFTGTKVHQKLAVVKFENIALDSVVVLVREGQVVPRKDSSSALTTSAVRLNPFRLLAVLDEDGRAAGSVYVDDGLSLDSIPKKKYSLVDIVLQPPAAARAAGFVLTTSVKEAGFEASNVEVDELVVYAVEEEVKNVFVKGKEHQQFKYDPELKTLTVNEIGVSILDEEFRIECS